MKKKTLPVYNLHQFNEMEEIGDIYANNFIPHLKNHHFINTPHKHDFYVVFLFTKGSGVHQIDFVNYVIKPGSVFFLSPGQSHHWTLSKDIDGYVFFHSKLIYDLNFTSKTITDFPFYNSIYNTPVLYLKTKALQQMALNFEAILREYKQKLLLKSAKLCNLIDCTYIDLARLYITNTQNKNQNQNYLSKLNSFERLIETHFKTLKFPSQYAEKMNMTEKHLNRICKTCLGKTTTDLISDRLMLEAKRLLVHLNYSVAQVADELGYLDTAYFSRVFKKKYAETPLAFKQKFISY